MQAHFVDASMWVAIITNASDGGEAAEMTSFIGTVVATAGMMIAPVGTTQVVPLEPSSKWSLNYGDTGCLLARHFGQNDAELLLAFRQIPVMNNLVIIVPVNSHINQYLRGNATFKVDSATVGTGNFGSPPPFKGGSRSALIFTNDDLRNKLPDNGVFEISMGSGAPITVNLRNTKSAFAALDVCNAEILDHWGVNSSERARIATPPKPIGDPSGWIQSYPVAALARGVQGTTILLWAVGVDGRASDCRTLLSSGVSELDRSACAELTNRARYSPAIDKDGHPMVAHLTRQIIWYLGGW